eukprot:m.174939 g.174939  ORF g.174939 m.174939 type:complete len:59 (+) comp18343_c0_seq1:106-282(+)
MSFAETLVNLVCVCAYVCACEVCMYILMLVRTNHDIGATRVQSIAFDYTFSPLSARLM